MAPDAALPESNLPASLRRWRLGARLVIAAVTSSTPIRPIIELSRFSSARCAIRVLVRVLRFVHLTRRLAETPDPQVLAERAEMLLIKSIRSTRSIHDGPSNSLGCATVSEREPGLPTFRLR